VGRALHLAVAVALCAAVAGAQRIEWAQSQRTDGWDEANGVAVLRGDVYVVGRSNGDLGGQAAEGGWDAFITKFDTNRSVAWTRLLGSPRNDVAYGVAAMTDFVYVVGSVGGSVGGQPYSGGGDAFVAKCNSEFGI
jgi:hypothetical protein